MAKSPMSFNGFDEEMHSAAVHTQDISEQMRVPKRIKATGEYYDDHEITNGMSHSWNYHDKIDMTVPDRIVVIGQDQHLGTRSAPREIILDNSILPTDPGHVRVSTPPRVITLEDHHFPTADDTLPDDEQFQADYDNRSVESSDDRRLLHHNRPHQKFFNPNASELIVQHSREATPPLSNREGLTPGEELFHLRRQVTKLNRRVLDIEIDNINRQQREKIIYAIGLAYFLVKTMIWLNKN